MRRAKKLPWNQIRLPKIETFYLTYDEPFKEERWNIIREQVSKVTWIDGIHGFDRAHKTCAERAKSNRILIIDGDNTLTPEFFNEKIPRRLYDSKYVLDLAPIIQSNQYGMVLEEREQVLWGTKRSEVLRKSSKFLEI